jgi:ribonuclease-3
VKADLKQLEAALGHEFSSPELLLRALTHRSLAHQLAQTGADKKTAPADNERLEFLGDAVLGLVVAEELFILHPEWRGWLAASTWRKSPRRLIWVRICD